MGNRSSPTWRKSTSVWTNCNAQCATSLHAAEPGPGYTSFSGPGVEFYEELSFWAAGHEPSYLPPGIGQRLPLQSDVILQIHYHPSGKPEAERSSVGFYLTDQSPRRSIAK